jgi:hypothetical protein
MLAPVLVVFGSRTAGVPHGVVVLSRRAAARVPDG